MSGAHSRVSRWWQMRREQRGAIAYWALFLLGAAALGWLYVQVSSAVDDLDEVTSTLGAYNAAVQELADGLDEVRRQVLELDEEPVVPPSEEITEDLPPIPSDADVELIPGPRGLAGQDGKDGKPGKDGIDGLDGLDGRDGLDGVSGSGPTDEQVAAAVAAYLAENPPPAGPPGPAGVMTCPDGSAPRQWNYDGNGQIGLAEGTYLICRTG